MMAGGDFGRSLAGACELRAWLDKQIPARLAVETVAVASACGRVAAKAIAAPTDLPSAPRAECDGVAVRAADTVEAGLYSPLRLSLSAGAAQAVEVGHQLPRGCDASIPWERVVAEGDIVTLSAPVAAGEEVSVAAADWSAGCSLLQSGERLSAPQISRLLAAGVETVVVCRCPEVTVIRAGKTSGADANTPVLTRLVTRDGARVSPAVVTEIGDLRERLCAVDADVVIVHGASGWGERDFAAAALAQAGTLDWHGVAAAPGGSVGVGLVGDTLVILLPGSPAGCFVGYELFVAALVRGFAGASDYPPYPVRWLPLAGKLASPLGVTELRFVTERDEVVHPLAPARYVVPPAASGFVVVAEGSEGAGAGEMVAVRIL